MKTLPVFYKFSCRPDAENPIRYRIFPCYEIEDKGIVLLPFACGLKGCSRIYLSISWHEESALEAGGHFIPNQVGR